MVNGHLIRHKKRKAGDKPIIYANCPESEFVCHYKWEEREDGIYQIWEITDLRKEEPEPKPEYMSETEQKARAYDILMGVSE